MMATTKIHHSMSMSCVQTLELKDMVMNDVGHEDETKPYYLISMNKYTILLLDFYQFPKEFRRFLKQNLLDQELKQELVVKGIINWCRTVKPLYPLKTRGDGNCLLHAVSLAMWGIHDSTTFLRRLVLVALVNDGHSGGGEIKKRWHKSKAAFNKQAVDGGIQYDNEEWETEWHQVLEATSDIKNSDNPNQPAYDYLEDIHVFVLANVIRRPIIILGDAVIRSPTGEAIAENHFSGIYLPLLWNSSVCVKSPIVLGYSNCHFAPLMGAEVEKTDRKRSLPEHAIPLVTKDLENLIIRFVSTEEESHYDILKQYLDVTELNLTRSDSVHFLPCAKLKYKRLTQFDIVKDYVFELQKIFIEGRENQNINQNSASSDVENLHSENEGKIFEEKSINFNVEEKEKTVALKKKQIWEAFPSENERKLLNTDQQSDIEMTSQENTSCVSNLSSSIEHKCKFDKCSNFATAKTYPYCFSHRRKRSNSFDEAAVEVCPNTHVKEHENRNSMNAKLQNFSETSKPCKVESCSLYGLKEWGYMCSQHRYNRQPSKNVLTNEWHKCRNPENRCLREGKAYLSGMCDQCYLEEGKKDTEMEKCTNSSCERLSNKEYGKYCYSCALDFTSNDNVAVTVSSTEIEGAHNGMTSMDILGLLPGKTGPEMKNAREFYKCKFPNCRQLSTESTLGLCTDHFLKMFRKGKINIPTEKDVAQYKIHMQKQRKSNSQEENLPNQNVAKEQKFNRFDQYQVNVCTVPGCVGVRCGNPYGMCFFCYDANKHNQKSSASHSVYGEVNAELIESVAPETSFASENCVSPLCQNKGKTSLRGLCHVCFNILCREHAMMEQMPKILNFAKDPATGSSGKLKESGLMRNKYSHKCKTLGCNMYGTQPHTGYCSRCFSQNRAAEQRRIQRREEERRVDRLNKMSPVEVMNELSIDRTLNYPRKCITPNCDLYGDPVFRGYCSRCAKAKGFFSNKRPQYETHRKIPVEHKVEEAMEIVPNVPEDWGYAQAMKQIEERNRTSQKCKTTGCLNYGSSRNKGLCSDCAKRLEIVYK